jgi:microcin C transport system substrate-binding protein
MMRHFLLLTMLLLAIPASGNAAEHAIAMFDDVKYPASFTHFDYTNPDAPKGGSTVNAAIGTFDSLNPFILKGVPAAGAAMLFDTLLENSKDETFSEYGLIAESLEVPADRSWVIFNLRKEARFHDGSPVTADDVVFSFDTLKKRGHPSYRAYYRDVVKGEKLAADKVKFTFAGGNNRELPLIIGQLPIISKAYYSTHDFEKSTLEPPLGSGPYQVEKVEIGRAVTYKRDPNYWAKDLPVNKGRHNIDHIRYDYYRDITVAVEAFKAGKYDFRQENISKVWANAYKFPAVTDGRVIKEEIKHNIPSGMQAFILNNRRPKFSDRKVREALNYAFDFEWENKNLFYSAYTRTGSYFSNSDFASSGLPSTDELALLTPLKDQIPAEVFTKVFASPSTDGSGSGIRQNLLTAKKLLSEAGWELRNGKLTNSKTNEVMSIEFLLDEPSFERAIGPFIKNLQKLGIDAKIRSIDSAQYQKRIQAFDYDVILETFAQSSSPGNEQINFWHSSKADVMGSRNLIGIKNPAIDMLVEKVINAASKQELIAATRALDRVLLWNYYVIPNWFSQSFRIVYWNKFSRPAITPKYELGLDTWWIDPVKAAALEKKK